jgi:anthraniloyl-CoA monooxygenase
LGGNGLPVAGRELAGCRRSPIPYFEGISQTPHALTRTDMDQVRTDFVRATLFGHEAGLRHARAAHGARLSTGVVSIPAHQPTHDEYGGDVHARLRFPLEVLQAVRAAWPAEKPLSVRISATDWADDGLTDEDLLVIAREFKAAGVDLIDVSTGQTVAWQKPVYGRMWQAPFADKVRNEIGIATIAVGNIYDPDHVNSIIAAGRADLCAIARPHLANPAWTLEAAARQGYTEQWWPPSICLARVNSSVICSVPPN